MIVNLQIPSQDPDNDFDHIKLNEQIEKFVRKTGENYIDAVVYVAEENDIEIESVAKMINNVIKQKIESEASDFNLLTYKINKLPL